MNVICYAIIADEAELIFAARRLVSTHPNSLTGGEWAAFEDGRIELP